MLVLKRSRAEGYIMRKGLSNQTSSLLTVIAAFKSIGSDDKGEENL